jgi:hypothetical protein
MQCMTRVLVNLAALLALVGSGCGGGGGTCDLPPQWSTASSGGLCQVNFFTEPEHAVFCGGSSGNWDCACGPAAENPLTFTSADFCDLDDEARACQAIDRCGFSL